jgi:hypothetical protein
MPISTTSVSDIRENEHALLKLLDDLKSFERAHHLDNRFNFFTAADMVNREVKHTKFLAFLLDPLEPHGLGDKFLRSILGAIVTEHPSSPLSRLDVAISDFGNVSVHTERDHFDIAIEIPRLNVLVVIENKIDSSESKDQLPTYRASAESKYKNFKFLGVFLTPEGREGEDEQWGALSYTTIASVLRLLLDEGLATSDVAVVVRHYVQLIERKIVASQELIDACKAIYLKHRNAIDLIIEHGQEPPLAKAFDLFVSGVTSNLQASTVRSSTAYFAFASWLDIDGYPQADRKQWPSTFPVQIWFEVKAKKVLLHLEVGPFKERSEGRSIVVNALREALGGAKPGTTKGNGAVYTRILNFSERLPEDPSVEDMAECLTRLWKKAPVDRMQDEVLAAVSGVSEAISQPALPDGSLSS